MLTTSAQKVVLKLISALKHISQGRHYCKEMHGFYLFFKSIKIFQRSHWLYFTWDDSFDVTKVQKLSKGHIDLSLLERAALMSQNQPQIYYSRVPTSLDYPYIQAFSRIIPNKNGTFSGEKMGIE